MINKIKIEKQKIKMMRQRIIQINMMRQRNKMIWQRMSWQWRLKINSGSSNEALELLSKISEMKLDAIGRTKLDFISSSEALDLLSKISKMK